MLRYSKNGAIFVADFLDNCMAQRAVQGSRKTELPNVKPTE